jgi:hypothetical protein
MAIRILSPRMNARFSGLKSASSQLAHSYLRHEAQPLISLTSRFSGVIAALGTELFQQVLVIAGVNDKEAVSAPRASATAPVFSRK